MFTIVGLIIRAYTLSLTYSDVGVIDFSVQLSCTDKGPVHFDENGLRDMTELRVFQYQTLSCMKKETLCGRAKLVEVAYIKDGKSLQFKEGDRNKIWPGY